MSKRYHKPTTSKAVALTPNTLNDVSPLYSAANYIYIQVLLQAAIKLKSRVKGSTVLSMDKFRH